MKSGNLNFVEPSGPFQACKGTALPLHMIFIKVRLVNIISSVEPNPKFNFLEKLKIQIFQNVNSTIFFIVVCGTLSLWLRKDHAVRLFENNSKKNIRCKELWRRLHKELHSFFLSPNQIGVIKRWRIKWEDSVARMGQM